MTEHTTLVRLARPADAEAIAALGAEIQRLHADALPGLFKPATDGSNELSAVRAMMDEPERLLLVAEEEGGAVIGYAIAEVQRRPESVRRYALDRLHVQLVVVRGDRQRRGVGRRLLAALREAAQARGLGSIYLKAWAFNEPARRFYESEGFAVAEVVLTLEVRDLPNESAGAGSKGDARTALPPAVAEAVRLLAPLDALDVPWALAGGWAIDLALGRVARAHADVDVMLFRDDQAALRRALPEWTFEVARGGGLAPWRVDERLMLPDHEVYAHAPASQGGATLELLLNERDGDSWVYRRDPAVRRPLGRAIVEGPQGLRLLAPELVLLYKSKNPRAHDEHDFAAARGLLNAESRDWLRAAIVRRELDHPWAALLAREA